MTDELRPVPGEDTSERERGTEGHEIDRGTDAPLEPESGESPPEESNPWLKEGADAPDAADIEEPSEQR